MTLVFSLNNHRVLVLTDKAETKRSYLKAVFQIVKVGFRQPTNNRDLSSQPISVMAALATKNSVNPTFQDQQIDENIDSIDNLVDSVSMVGRKVLFII